MNPYAGPQSLNRQTPKLRNALIAAVAILTTASAFASTVTTYSGQDDGAPVGGPFPHSAAAQTSFETAASAYGTLNTITFEGLPVGYATSYNLASGVTATLNAPNYGPGYNGISKGSANPSYPNLYGFNTTKGGSEYLAITEGSATFDFSHPTDSFGFYLTGLQTVFTSLITLTFDDGTSQTLHIPINTNGGAQYFGFTDPTAVSAVTVTDLSNDAWGIDDLTYNKASTSVTPEPSSIVLLGTGLLGLAGVVRRRLSL